MNAHTVDVDKMLERARSLVKGYTGFLQHTPKMLRQSMMLAYQTAVDDMLKAMDASRVENPVQHKEEKRVVLLDEKGHAV